MIAPATKPRVMTDDEKLDMAERIGVLRERGWTMTQIADHLGYSNPSTLYAARRDVRGIEVERYRELCRVHADNRPPPTTRQPRNGRNPSIAEERVDRFLEVVAGLQKIGVTQEAQAKAAGYGSGAGLRMALRTRRIPVEVHDRIMQLAAAKRVIEAPRVVREAPNGTNRGRWGVTDYFQAVANNLESCSALLEEAAQGLSNPLTEPGYERFLARIRELHQVVRAVVT